MADSELPTSFDLTTIVGPANAPFVGYISSKDKTTVTGRALVRGSKNVYKKLSGTIANRPGLKRRGTADATFAGVKSSVEWNTSLGRVFPLRVVDGKLQFESSIISDEEDEDDVVDPVYVWYDLLTGLTLDRFVFDTWWDNTNKKDKLLMVNGDDIIYDWSGGLTAVLAGSINTITKYNSETTWAEDGFTPTGQVVIEGVTYTYTGGTGTQILTGVTPDASGINPSSITVPGYQPVVANSSKPVANFKSDFIKVVNNQLFVGSYSSRLTYISDDSDYTNFTVPGTRAPGDPELLTLDAPGKGIGLRQGVAHIFAGTSYLHRVIFSQITVGSVLTEQTKAPREDLANLQGALAHEFIDTVGDSLIYLTQENQLVIYGTYRNINQAKYPSLSLAVQDELSQENFSGGHLRSIGEFIYITAPTSGRTYLHQTRELIDALGNITAERLWHPPQVWNAQRIAVINGVVFGHSNVNPQIYQLWDTEQWHDDSPEDEPLPYDSVMRLAYWNYKGRRQGLAYFDKVYTEGYISEGSVLNAYVLYDYQGSSSIQNPNINSVEKPVKFFIGANPPSLGDAPIGDNPLGDGLTEETIDQEMLPKFRCINSLSIVNCFEYQLVIYSSEVDSRWEIICVGTNAQLTRNQQATFLVKRS